MANQVQKAEKEKVVKVREDKKRMTYTKKSRSGQVFGLIETLEKNVSALLKRKCRLTALTLVSWLLSKKNWMRNEVLPLKYTNDEYISINLS